MRVEARSQAGQATVEWTGLVLLVAGALATLAAVAGLALHGTELAGVIGSRLLCAVGIDGPCSVEESRLELAYGAELAAAVAEHAPSLRYEKGMKALPIDYRRCREDACADGSQGGEVSRSNAGNPVVAFVRAVDCRSGVVPPETQGEADCSGPRRGNLYLQYWFYYPGSATGEGSIAPALVREVTGGASHHPDDWESYQVRVGPGGEPSARASSHHWYSYALGGRRGWGPSLGSIYVSGGSHAGNVFAVREVDRVTPAARVRLVPLEPIAARGPKAEFAVTPPWLKRVWLDPEYEGTD